MVIWRTCYCLVLDAAGDTTRSEKLLAYCLTLASGAMQPDDQDRWRAALVRTLRDLDSEHFDLLDRFTWTSNRLGLGDGVSEDFDTVPESLNQTQVEMVAGDIPVLHSALATLQRLGLLANSFFTPGTFGGGGTPIGIWKITEFGIQLLELLRYTAHLLGDASGTRE